MARERVFSGIQPTGDGVHLGNYLGAIKGMLDLQREHECVFSVVDYHAITVPYEPLQLQQRIEAVARDYLAAGIDPERSILMVQSDIQEHVELAWILGCLTTVNKLSHLPTYKDKVKRYGVAGLGQLSYPVLMAADILLYEAELVPVGKDQLPHIEFAREVARAFNQRFGEVLPEPRAYLVPGAVVPSLLGQGAMSKSVPGSFIALSDDAEVVRTKLASAVTDPARQRRMDPGEPTRCVVYALHQLHTADEQLSVIAAGCRGATIGCLVCKAILADKINSDLEPIRERGRELRANPAHIHRVLHEGALRARPLAQATMHKVKQVMGLSRE